MMKLTELAERVRALTSACRETDALIDCYLRGWTFVAYEKQFSGHVYHWRKGGVGSLEAMVNVQPFTASLDAAMTLRLPAWSYSLRTAEHHENGFIFDCWVSWGPTAFKRIEVRAKTEAGAAASGWLRARAALENSHG